MAEFGEVLLADSPADHGVGQEACLLVADDRGETAHHP